MNKRIFTPEQIKTLLQNPNVVNCSERSISYHKEFKVSAVRKYNEGMSPSWIFKAGNFNLTIIGRKTPKWCMGRWLRIFREKGETGLETDSRGQHKSGGRPKSINHLPDKEKIKYLEAEIAYLKAENDFLAKLRKKS